MRKTLLFRSVLGETGVLTDKPMNRVDGFVRLTCRDQKGPKQDG
jgi:hypothetical protein